MYIPDYMILKFQLLDIIIAIIFYVKSFMGNPAFIAS